MNTEEEAPNWKNYRLNKMKELPVLALTEGNGSGTKLFQSLMDGHPELLMIPGYPLMYFYPFWEHYIVPTKSLDWTLIIDEFINRFAPIFDSRHNPGSEDLDRLGEGKNEYITVDKNLFKKIFINMVEDVDISPRNCLIAIHYSYALATGDSLADKKILVYHIHVFDYIEKYLISDFPHLKVITSARDPRANLMRRELNSIIRPNKIKFRKSDACLMAPRAYRQANRFLLNGMDCLRCVNPDNVRAFSHEDLALRLESVMKNTAKFMGVSYKPLMLQSTFAGKTWITSFYDFDTSKLVNPDILNENWRFSESIRDIFVLEGINIDYINKYEYPNCVYFSDTISNRLLLAIKILLPSSIEKRRFLELFSFRGFNKFIAILYEEALTIQSLPSYKNNMFYTLKWTNDGINFSKNRLFDLMLASKIGPKWFCLIVASVVYFLDGVFKYTYTFFRTPWEWLLRVVYCYQALLRRLIGKRFLPDLL